MYTCFWEIQTLTPASASTLGDVIHGPAPDAGSEPLTSHIPVPPVAVFGTPTVPVPVAGS